MEVAMEVEDDVFFADLSKQISLLIMDDEEDTPPTHCPSLSLQVFSQAIHPTTQSSISYEQTCRRESKGTGVFIPRLSQPRRKNRQQGRYHSSSTKSHKQLEDTRGLQQFPCSNNNNNNNSPSYDSFNHRRF